MLRKGLGLLLMIAAAGMALVLLSNGRLVFPHIIGPITLAVIGAILMMFNKKVSPSTE